MSENMTRQQHENEERERLAALHDYPVSEHLKAPTPIFEFTVHEVQPGHWEAWTPYRAIRYCGSSEYQAIGRMLADMARLGYLGAIDWRDPEKPMVGPGCRLQQIRDLADYQLRRDGKLSA